MPLTSISSFLCTFQLGDGTSLVTVMAGTTTGEFKEFELENDVVLHSSAILPVFEMGGLVSMACHVSCIHCLNPFDAETTFVKGSTRTQNF